MQGTVTGSTGLGVDAGPLPGQTDPAAFEKLMRSLILQKRAREDREKAALADAMRPPLGGGPPSGGPAPDRLPVDTGPREGYLPIFADYTNSGLGRTGGYGPASVVGGPNKTQVGEIPASQAAAYGGPSASGFAPSIPDQSSTSELALDAEHDAWRAANPGVGPYSGTPGAAPAGASARGASQGPSLAEIVAAMLRGGSGAPAQAS